MKKSILIKVLFGFLLCTAMACKTQKSSIAISKPTKKTQENLLMQQFTQADITFNTFSTKAKTEIKIDSSTYNINVNIRIKKNDTIWISASYFGIEAGRVLITPDSIKFLNRLQAQYFIKPFSYLHKFTNPKIDFLALEAMLTGNTLPFYYNKENVITADSTGYTIKGLISGLGYLAYVNSVFKTVKSVLNSNTTGQQLQINYANFIPSNNQNIPTQLIFNSKVNKKNIGIDMLYSTPQIDKLLEYPFVIPKRFTAIE
ncbi:MAG: DUF4292 domain-containing protein [Sphingobacteriales bacterium]|nr:MAG: DUF4292 domain-containing protein [Sphingobacteriales bacterium]TAF78461.1 MAG: DUF4292 domain-containing protein [Sphingobacteriales bacterium]